MSAKLILNLNGATISEHELTAESVSIGRKPENDVVVDNLAVSGKHAQIITILNDSFLEDLNSTNGTYVNGTLVKKHALKDGDIVGIGKHQLIYVNENANDDEGDFEKTMIIRPDAGGGIKEEKASPQLNASVAAMAKEAASQPAPAGKAKLQVLNGANSGKELQLTKALTTIGKPGTQVAAITRRPQGYFVIHVEGGSDNRTPLVNSEPTGTKAHPLSNNDIVEVAGIKLQFFIE